MSENKALPLKSLRSQGEWFLASRSAPEELLPVSSIVTVSRYAARKDTGGMGAEYWILIFHVDVIASEMSAFLAGAP